MKANVQAAEAFIDISDEPDQAPTYPEFESLTDEQIAVVVQHGKSFEKWLKSVTEEAKKRIENGTGGRSGHSWQSW